VVIAQEPILSPFKSRMEERIAQSLNIKKENVNIKAKTNEGLDDIGRKEAIAAYAVVIMEST
jgi:2-C-methyl-D-erythritol 2,4-cyclodiphosphate synthase